MIWPGQAVSARNRPVSAGTPDLGGWIRWPGCRPIPPRDKGFPARRRTTTLDSPRIPGLAVDYSCGVWRFVAAFGDGSMSQMVSGLVIGPAKLNPRDECSVILAFVVAEPQRDPQTAAPAHVSGGAVQPVYSASGQSSPAAGTLDRRVSVHWRRSRQRAVRSWGDPPNRSGSHRPCRRGPQCAHHWGRGLGRQS